MNIFYLDQDPEIAASYHCDAHVIKMILEYAQIMCTNFHLTQSEELINSTELYKPTHKNHPCTIWARESFDNTTWLFECMNELNNIYKAKSKRDHKSFLVGGRAYVRMDINKFPDDTLTNPPQAMPDIFRLEDTVEAYRKYYKEDKSLNKWFKYTYNNRPNWIK